MDLVCLNYEADEEVRESFFSTAEIGQLHEILLSIGIPPNIRGYSYITYAMELIIRNPEAMYSVTKGLYIDVAKKFGTKPASVERSIRFAIGSAWKYGDQQMIDQIFSNCLRPYQKAPSNSVFLARLYYHYMSQS